MLTIKKIFIITFFFFFLNSCSNFKPLYKNNLSSLYALQEVSIITDKKKISENIKKNLIELFPTNKKTKYILKIEGLSETTGTVSDTTRKISRYKNQVSANVKIYYRQKKYDKLIYEFYEKRDASYSLILNNIRSTIASKKNAELTSTRLLSEEIYKRVLVFLSKN
ncbi:MAG: hypothetical protein CM15mP56_1630 [Alphaproteobacteria bacterium]|nr:MAG: hypothetical protein CM15mP56_1630 [Alphaproteobacteria bacterium]